VASFTSASFFTDALSVLAFDFDTAPPPTKQQRGGGYDVRVHGSKGASPDYSEWATQQLEAEQAQLKATRLSLAAARKVAAKAHAAARAVLLEQELQELNAKLAEVTESLMAARALEIQLQEESDDEDLLMVTMMASPFMN